MSTLPCALVLMAISPRLGIVDFDVLYFICIGPFSVRPYRHCLMGPAGRRLVLLEVMARSTDYAQNGHQRQNRPPILVSGLLIASLARLQS